MTRGGQLAVHRTSRHGMLVSKWKLAARYQVRRNPNWRLQVSNSGRAQKGQLGVQLTIGETSGKKKI